MLENISFPWSLKSVMGRYASIVSICAFPPDRVNYLHRRAYRIGYPWEIAPDLLSIHLQVHVCMAEIARANLYNVKPLHKRLHGQWQVGLRTCKIKQSHCNLCGRK